MSLARSLRRMARRGAVLSAMLALLAGCISNAGIAPEATRLDVTPVLGSDETFTAWPEDHWWEAFGQNELDRLVGHALERHPDVTFARARLAEAEAAVAFVSARLGPELGFNVATTLRRYPEDSLYPPELAGDHEFDTRLAFDALFDPDFFGRNRHLVAAASAQVAAGEAYEDAVKLDVAAGIARVYFALAREIAERNIVAATRKQREHILDLVEVRVRKGLDSNLELAQASGVISQVQGEYERLEENIVLLRTQLARLAVVDPASTAALEPALPAMAAPDVPREIPSDLLARRADVVAARRRVEAALAGTESVKAEFYPSVNLAAFAGMTAIGLSALFESGARTYGFAPRLHLPVFDAGRLRAKLRFASAEVDKAVADYNATLLAALQDVIRAMTSLRALDGRRAAQADAQHAAERAYELAVKRFEAGLTGYLSVLATESDVLEQQRAGAALRARALLLTVDLNRALGGGYTDRSLAAK